MRTSTLSFAAFTVATLIAAAMPPAQAATPVVAVGAQYDSTHVYVTPADMDRFVDSFTAVMGGKGSKAAVTDVTPTPSKTVFRYVFSPHGTLSVFGFTTPIPYPFGSERTGYLVTDMDIAVKAAVADGASVIVAPFPDPIGRDVVIQWPGGVNMQLYWHKATPHYAPLSTVPENRVYVSPGSVDAFLRGFGKFAHATIVSDDPHAPGIEIGRPGSTYRRVRVISAFGKMTVLVTDGHLPFPYGREITGYEVPGMDAALASVTASGGAILAGPYTAGSRHAAMVEFPGGYIAEIHAAIR